MVVSGREGVSGVCGRRRRRRRMMMMMMMNNSFSLPVIYLFSRTSTYVRRGMYFCGIPLSPPAFLPSFLSFFEREESVKVVTQLPIII